MGRKPGSWSTEKGFSVLNKHKRAILKRIRAGDSLVEVSADFTTSHTNLHRWLDSTGIRDEQVECVLVECSEVFPWKPGKLACCRLHIKRYCARGRSPGEFLPCCLPECDEPVLVTKRGERSWWCCNQHGYIHYARVSSGFYDRLVNRNQRCVGRHENGRQCAEWRCIDEHHINHEKGKSDKDGPVVLLCPTHHQAIHRGLAEFEDGVYLWKVRLILEGLREKHPNM